MSGGGDDAHGKIWDLGLVDEEVEGMDGAFAGGVVVRVIGGE